MAYVNLRDARKLIKIAHKSDLVPALVGGTGIAKSQMTKQLAIEENIDFVPVFLSEKEPSDFTGLQMIDDNKRSANCPPNWLPWRQPTPEMIASNNIPRDQGYIFPQGGIIFFDEFNTAKDEMRQACKEALTDRRIGTYFFPSNYRLVIAMNPANAGNNNVYDLDDPNINRLAWIKVQPDFQEVIQYLDKKHGVNPITLWLQNCGGENFLNPKLDFEIEGMIHSSRTTDAQITFWKNLEGETDLFKRAALETIMKTELVESFLSYCEQLYIINYKDILFSTQTDKVKEIIADKRWDIESVVIEDLAKFFQTYEFGKTKFEVDDNTILNRVCTFLSQLSDELCVVFIDSLNSPIENLRCISKQEIFKQKIISAKLGQHKTARKTAKEMNLI